MRQSVIAAGLMLLLTACATAPLPKPLRAGHAPLAVAPDAVAAPAAAAALVSAAMSMVGQPYRYGGAAPGGFDCSGLVVYAAGSAGLRVPRTTSEQLLVGTAVPRADLRAGDLVFMHLKAKQLHVGIAVDAARFVHAPATGKRVRVDSLDAPAYARAFLSARRIVDAAPAAAARAAGVQSPAGGAESSAGGAHPTLVPTTAEGP